MNVYGDDIGAHEPAREVDQDELEIERYRALTLTAEHKKDLDPLKWWENNKTSYPRLYLTAIALLPTPATSVPAECVFSLAGNIVRKKVTIDIRKC